MKVSAWLCFWKVGRQVIPVPHGGFPFQLTPIGFTLLVTLLAFLSFPFSCKQFSSIENVSNDFETRFPWGTCPVEQLLCRFKHLPRTDFAVGDTVRAYFCKALDASDVFSDVCQPA